MSNKNFTILVFLLGAVGGILLAKCGGWNFVEPVIGIATLAVAGLGWLNSIRVERRLGDSMDHRKFEITFGLRAGYEGEEVDYTLADARAVIHRWMSQRVEKSLPILAGMTQDVVLIYPVRNGEDGRRVTEEISGQFSGSLSPKYDKERSDAEIIGTLNDLAQCVGRELEQKCVYVSFAHRQWVVNIETEKIRSEEAKDE